jgi:hypothetical protein
VNVVITLGRSAPARSGSTVYLDHLRHEISRGRGRVKLWPHAFTMVAAIIVSPCRLHGRELVSIIYGQEPDGGPVWADHCIHTFAIHARKKLRPLGITFRATRDAGYQLIDLWEAPETIAAPPHGVTVARGRSKRL